MKNEFREQISFVALVGDLKVLFNLLGKGTMDINLIMHDDYDRLSLEIENPGVRIPASVQQQEI